jgi:hypothetical protein
MRAQMFERGRGDAFLTCEPIAVIFGAIQSGMSDTQKQPHQCDTFVRANREVTDAIGFVKGLL